MKKYKALLSKQKILPVTPVEGFVSLVEAVAGEKIKGSWWGHPKGKEIFAISEALDDLPDVLVIKLLDKKLCFVSAELFPALYRVVTEKKIASFERSEHTPSGKHVKKQVLWSDWATAEVKAAAKKLAFDEAYEILSVAGRGHLTLPG